MLSPPNSVSVQDSNTKKKNTYATTKTLSPPKDFADWDEGRLSTNKAYQMLKQQTDSLKKKVKELKSKDTKVVIDKTDYAAVNRLEAALEKERQERKRADQ